MTRWTGLFSITHSRTAYYTDFVIYGAAVGAMLIFVALHGAVGQRALLAALALGGFAAWSLLEYGLHRFVLHGLAPFNRWHAAHHAQPMARISTPTVVSAGLIGLLVLAPAWWALGSAAGTALTLGVTAGYFVYAVTHHAVHHWRSGSSVGSRWLQQRKVWHAVHHLKQASGVQPGRYGVSLSLWDSVFKTDRDATTALIKK